MSCFSEFIRIILCLQSFWKTEWSPAKFATESIFFRYDFVIWTGKLTLLEIPKFPSLSLSPEEPNADVNRLYVPLV